MQYTQEQLEAMSDFDINQMIAKIGCIGQSIEWLPQRAVCGILLPDFMDNACYLITPLRREQKVDFCNNWSDIGALIESNRIGLTFGSEMCSAVVVNTKVKMLQVTGENVKRCAAIVYLLMEEVEK